MKSEMIGTYEIELVNSDGTICEHIGEQKNLILDEAMNFADMYVGSPYLAIGSGVVTAPAVTDTNLGNQIATKMIFLNAYVPVVDEGSTFLVTFRGAAEFINVSGEISELGLRRSASGSLITRALIKDSSGNPRPITVNADQKLKITYSLYKRVDKLISTGITPTPHGDLHWELVTDEGNVRVDTNHSMIPRTGGYIGGAAASGTFNTDLPGRKVSFSFMTAAKTADRILPIGRVIATSTYSSYSFKLTQPFTIPAYYELTVDFETSWGRRL